MDNFKYIKRLNNKQPFFIGCFSSKPIKLEKEKSITLEIVDSVTDIVIFNGKIKIDNISYFQKDNNKVEIVFIVDTDTYNTIMYCISKTKYIIDTDKQGIDANYEYRIVDTDGINFVSPGAFCIYTTQELTADKANYRYTGCLYEKMYYIKCIYTNNVEII